MNIDHANDIIIPQNSQVLKLGGLGAVQIPTGTNQQRPSCKFGLLRANKTTGQIEVCLQSEWINLTTTKLTGDVIGEGGDTITATLSKTGITPGSYTKLTIDGAGRATHGSFLSKDDIVNALGYSPLKPTDVIDVRQGGLGTTTRAGALNVILPDQQNKNNHVLTTTGNAVYWSEKDTIINEYAKYRTVILRNTTTNANKTELFLNGVNTRFIIPHNTACTYTILVSGISVNGNDHFGTTLQGMFTRHNDTVLIEFNKHPNVIVETNDTLGALTVSVVGIDCSMRWAASITALEASGE